MARTLFLGVLCILLTGARCTSKQTVKNGSHLHETAASLFTRRYAASRFAPWQIRATAGGSDCAVLFVQTSIILEDSMIEALHYGAGTYGVYNGGVQQFAREHAFRGVAYKDASGRIWTYGTVSPEETEGGVACH